MASRQGKAIGLALVAILFWSTMATAFSLALRQLDFINLLLWSSFISLVGLAVVLAWQGKWAMALKAIRTEWKHSLLMGLLNPFLYYFILLQAYEMLPAQEAMALNYTWPVMLALLSIPLLGQRIRPTSLLAILISFAGIILISTHGDPLSFRFTYPLGDTLALGSSVIWALFWIYNVRSQVDPVIKLFLNFIPGFGLSLLALIVMGRPLIIPQDAGGWLAVVYIGLFEMGITFVIWLTALRLTDSTQRISQLVFLSPFLSLLWIRIFLGEHILPATVTGLVLVIAGILLNQWKGRGEKANG